MWSPCSSSVLLVADGAAWVPPLLSPLLEERSTLLQGGDRGHLHPDVAVDLRAEDRVELLCRVNIDEEKAAAPVGQKPCLPDLPRFHHPLDMRPNHLPELPVRLRATQRVVRLDLDL